MPDRSCGLMLATEMVWIRLRERVDLCVQKWVWRWVQRESNKSEKIGRERERAYVKGLVERNNKKIEKIGYLNKRGDRIDELMWVFCKNGCVK